MGYQFQSTQLDGFAKVEASESFIKNSNIAHLMKIIVTMVGKGIRFLDAGYSIPKPLIEINGRPIIEFVVDSFSRKFEFIFICNKEHLENSNMEGVLRSIAPNCKIIGIDDSDADIPGPVYSSSFVFDLVDDEEEVIVSYCDFDIEWDFQNFLRTVRSKDCDGAIPSFTGFQPASLGQSSFARIEIDEDDYITDVQEKVAYSEDAIDDYRTTGVHYFKRGVQFKKYCRAVIDNKINVGGEAYMTLPFMLMIRDGMKILSYNVSKNICFGTPKAYETYKFWSEFFLNYNGYNKSAIKDYKEFLYWQDYFHKLKKHPYTK